MLPIEPGVDYAALIALDRQRLIELLEGVDPGSWEWPTPCPGWDVLELVTHLVGVDLSVIGWLGEGFRRTNPPEGLDDRGFAVWIDDLQMEWVRAARRISPQLAIGLLGWLGERLVRVIEDRDPSVVDADVPWASDDPVPRWLDHARELTERWIHRQQLLEALGRPLDLDPVLLVPVLDALRWAYPFRLGQVVRPAGSTVAIDVTGEGVSMSWILESDGSGWSFRSPEHPYGKHLAVMSASAEQAWRRLSNNVPGIAGSPVTSGEQELVSVLEATSAIIGNPT